VELADGVTLLLPSATTEEIPGPQALSAVRDAARPLLDTLVRHGLMPAPSDPRDLEGETP
jgi:hypothetical protein